MATRSLLFILTDFNLIVARIIRFRDRTMPASCAVERHVPHTLCASSFRTWLASPYCTSHPDGQPLPLCALASMQDHLAGARGL